jgi:hypothetical protein
MVDWWVGMAQPGWLENHKRDAPPSASDQPRGMGFTAIGFMAQRFAARRSGNPCNTRGSGYVAT